MARMQDTTRIQAWTILSAGGIYSWLFTHEPNHILSYGYYIVPFLLLVSALYIGESTLRIIHIAIYLKRIEQIAFGATEDLPGWERYKQNRNGIAVIGNVMVVILWAAMIAGSLYLAVVLSREHKTIASEPKPPASAIGPHQGPTNK